MIKPVTNILLVTILITLINLNSSAQSKIAVQFQNSSLQKKFLSQNLDKSNESSLGLDSILTKLQYFLTINGFLNSVINIDSTILDSINIFKINVNEGEQFIIKSIKKLEDLSSEEHNKINSIFIGAIFNQENIEKISLYIVNFLESKGYPFAEVKFLSYRTIDAKDDKKFVELIFTVNKNQPARISRIEIIGNKFTDKNVIVREMRINQGDFFTPDLSKKVLIRLNRLNIFSMISEPQFYFDDNIDGIFEIKVKEGNTNYLDGIIGYVPSQISNEKGYLTGQVNISLRNLFGTLRAFSFKWNKLNRYSQDFEIKYFEPWVFGLPVNFTPVFNQIKQDTVYIQRTFSGLVESFLSEDFGLTFKITSGATIPQLNYFVFNVNKSSSFSYGLGIIYDSRDNPIFTKSGVLFRTEINRVIKKDYLDLETKKYQQQKGDLAILVFQSFLKNQLIFLSINAKVIDGSGISLSDLFRFGGMNSLRGYEENQFSGSKIFWSNMEYRFFLNYTDYISVFFDYGFYFRNILNEKISKFKYGYGVGGGFNTPMGLLKVNFALGEGDTFSRGKIHFGIVSGF